MKSFVRLASALAIVAPLSLNASFASAHNHDSDHHKEYRHNHAALNLTSAQVRTLAEARLIKMRSKQLKVGSVTPSGTDAYQVTLVNADNQKVLTYTISKNTGRFERTPIKMTEAQAETLVQARLIRQGQANDLHTGKASFDGEKFFVPILNTENEVVRTQRISPNHRHHHDHDHHDHDHHDDHDD